MEYPPEDAEVHLSFQLFSVDRYILTEDGKFIRSYFLFQIDIVPKKSPIITINRILRMDPFKTTPALLHSQRTLK